jgi:hypothetical protein
VSGGPLIGGMIRARIIAAARSARGDGQRAARVALIPADWRDAAPQLVSRPPLDGRPRAPLLFGLEAFEAFRAEASHLWAFDRAGTRLIARVL